MYKHIDEYKSPRIIIEDGKHHTSYFDATGDKFWNIALAILQHRLVEGYFYEDEREETRKLIEKLKKELEKTKRLQIENPDLEYFVGQTKSIENELKWHENYLDEQVEFWEHGIERINKLIQDGNKVEAGKLAWWCLNIRDGHEYESVNYENLLDENYFKEK